MIAIKGMEKIPDNCNKCVICDYNDYYGYRCRVTQNECELIFEKRNSDCPLVEIPNP